MVKIDARTPNGQKKKVKATGMMQYHAEDGDFDINATTRSGTPVTLSGNMFNGAKYTYGATSITIAGPAPTPTVDGILEGKFKQDGHVFKAKFYALSNDGRFEFTKGKITGHLEEEHHDE